MENGASSDEEECLLPDEEGGVLVDGIYIPPPTKPYYELEIKGPRLIITRIENNFFKSYAQSQILGPFHKCFNAIVGPNGSGKSNVIDSMLFVFGYRAAKIRSKKLSVLIHNSSNFRNVNSCSVAVHFALIEDTDSDLTNVIPGSEFIVSRTAFKDNSSYYELNGKKLLFKDVAVLLKKYGIDLDHNRFLILQGEVEQISMMKPKAGNEHETGMLEYLEDIIGTTRFKKPLKQLEERVELLSEQRSDKLNRLKSIEDQIEELKKPMSEAVEFLTLENNIIKSQNKIYQKKLHDLDKLSAEAQEDVGECQSNQIAMREKIQVVQDELSSKENANVEISKQYNDLEKRANMLQKASEKACTKDTQLRDEMTEINKRRKKNIEQLANEEKKLEKLEQMPARNVELIAQSKTKLENLRGKRETLLTKRLEIQESLKEDIAGLQEEREASQSDLNKLKKKVDETKAAYDIANSELNMYTENDVKKQELLATLESTVEETNSKIVQQAEEVKTLKKKIPLTEKSLNDATGELEALKLKESQLIDVMNRDRMHLEEMKSMINSTRSRGRIVDALMEQKRRGNCPGLFGRLGDLGAIDLKYDVAISTACGPLDHLVVDTVETAKWCVEYLKQNDIGRVSIIALEKQQHLWNQINKGIQTPENVPRLFDLIQMENEDFKPAFYYGLRDTLVATNLDQATRVAYGNTRFRVVTLGGDLIEISGTMTGGGNRVSKGRMGQSIVSTQIQPEDIHNVESKLQNMQTELRQYQGKQNSLESQINVLQLELKKMTINYEKFTIEEKTLKQHLNTLREKLAEQKVLAKTTNSDPKVLKKLEGAVATAKNAYDVAVQNTTELQQKVDEISAEIAAKTKGKLGAVNSQIKETEATIKDLESKTTKLEVEIRSAERDTDKCKTAISRLRKDISAAEDSLRSKQAERMEIETDSISLANCLEEVTAELDKIKHEYETFNKQLKKLKGDLNKLKSDEIEVDQKLKTASEKLSDVKGNCHKWKVTRDRLKLHEIPDETVETLEILSEEAIAEMNLQHVERGLAVYEESIKKLKPNLSIIEEYKKKRAFYVEKAKEVEEIINKRKKMKDLHESLRTRRKNEFLSGYSTIKIKFKEMYRMITLGGDADFELVDAFDPFSEGVQLNVRPPKKTWKIISNLSGGEKTLTSLAVVFALHYYKPSPLYVMDEIDAALDFKNVSIVANYIKERTKNAQFIIISLRNYMFELADHLVGIYKTYDNTKSVTISIKDFEDDENRERNENIIERRGQDEIREIANGNLENADVEENGDNREEFSDMDMEANPSL